MSKNNKLDIEAPMDKTSPTTFGNSVESKAQIADAKVRSSAYVGEGEALFIYRLVPIAQLNDPRWDNSPYQREVMVAAINSGDARLVASGLERDFMETSTSPANGITTNNASAFRDDKLYTVIQLYPAHPGTKRGLLPI